MKTVFLIILLCSTSRVVVAETNEGGLERTLSAHLGEGEPYTAELHYHEGLGYYARGQYAEALTRFRQAAVADPDTPHLAAYMIHAEHEAQREEELRLGIEKENAFETWIAMGKKNLDHKEFKEAEDAFQKALIINPNNVEAQHLLARAKDEPVAEKLVSKQADTPVFHPTSTTSAQDPVAAQRHYQAGLMAYAKHDLKEAHKEWILTARLDSHHPKVFQAIDRVQQEMALSENAGK